MDDKIGAAYVEEALRSLRGHKRLAEAAFAQLRDEDFFLQLDDEANSIAILIKHLSGNMRSRFLDFLTSDGEKPDRDRDQEFILEPRPSRSELMRWWQAGWKYVFDAITPLQSEDLARVVTIRHEPHTVLQAIHRQVAHYAYHVGQIVLLAKHIRGAEWKSLSVPRGKSAEYIAKMAGKHTDSDVQPVLGEEKPRV